MCGIAGVHSTRLSPSEIKNVLGKMTDAIIHRGPDASGIWMDEANGLGLGHRRLSILDLSEHGNQPMDSEVGALAFNGEIYNFKIIRKQLEKEGQAFKGHSDTEVLLCALNNWGIDSTLSQIKGMFAFAYWDKREQVLHLVRDRIGEKPLYYGLINGTLAFASELKAIYQLISPKDLTTNRAALLSFVRFGYVSAPLTIFEEILKLAPGHLVSFNLKHTPSLPEPQAFWQLNTLYNEQELYSDENLALKDTDELLNKIIREQAIADVPLGSFLSGGIDSTLVTSVLQANSNKPIETFTIGFHEKSFNEAEFAKAIAKHLGTNHNELYLSAQDTLNVIPDLPRFYDEPFSDSSQIPTFLVSKFARSKLTVCLSGDGGDELFCGYNRYTQGARFQKLNRDLPKIARTILSSLLQIFPPTLWDKIYQGAMSFLGRKGGANFGLKLQKLAIVMRTDEPAAIYKFLCGYWQEPASLLANPATEDDSSFNALPFHQDFIQSAMAWDQQYYLPGDNLVKTDRASMAVSLEVRVPLLDREMIEHAWKIPVSMKYKNDTTKWILRQILYNYVPKELIERPKMGFSIPISNWIRNELKDWTYSLLAETRLKDEGIFDAPKIAAILDSHMKGKIDCGNGLWTLLMYQAWRGEYYRA